MIARNLMWLAPALMLGAWDGQRSERCAIYEGAIAEAAEGQTALVVDSTGAGVPHFAFMGMASFGRAHIDSLKPLPDSALGALEKVNAAREPLQDCVRAPASTVSIDSLRALFNDAKGWDRFHTRYPDAKRFVMISKPLRLDDSTVLVYVAYAADWLNGAGVLVKLRRDANGRWVRRARAFLWMA